MGMAPDRYLQLGDPSFDVPKEFLDGFLSALKIEPSEPRGGQTLTVAQ